MVLEGELLVEEELGEDGLLLFLVLVLVLRPEEVLPSVKVLVDKGVELYVPFLVVISKNRRAGLNVGGGWLSKDSLL